MYRHVSPRFVGLQGFGDHLPDFHFETCTSAASFRLRLLWRVEWFLINEAGDLLCCERGLMRFLADDQVRPFIGFGEVFADFAVGRCWGGPLKDARFAATVFETAAMGTTRHIFGSQRGNIGEHLPRIASGHYRAQARKAAQGGDFRRRSAAS